MPFTSYLVVGGFGSVGSAVATQIFKSTNAKIVVLDAFNGHDTLLSPEILNSERFIPVIGSSVNEKLFERLLVENKVECVIDCASKADTPYVRQQNPVIQARNATQGLTHMMNALHRFGDLKSFVLVSSQKVYGDVLPQRESASINPCCLHGAALMSAEAMLHSYVVSYSLPMAIARLSSDVVGKSLEQIKSSTQSGVHNLITLEDASKGILLVADNAKDGDVYNIGGEVDYTIEEVIQLLEGKKVSGRQSRLDTAKIRKHGFVNRPIDFTTSVNANSPVIPVSSKFLIFGADRPLGKLFKGLLLENKVSFKTATTCPGSDTDAAVEEEINIEAPSHVVMMAGKQSEEPRVTETGILESGPDRLRIIMRDNLYAPWLVASLCEKNGIHCTCLATGCKFNDQEEHPTDKGNTEGNISSFHDTSQSAVTHFTDRLLRQFMNTLQCRMTSSHGEELKNSSDVKEAQETPKFVNDCLSSLLDLAIERKTGMIKLMNPRVTLNCQIPTSEKTLNHEDDIKEFSEPDSDVVMSACPLSELFRTPHQTELYAQSEGSCKG